MLIRCVIGTFYFVAIFAAAMLPLLILFVPETAFRREARFDIDTMGNLIEQELPSGTRATQESTSSAEMERLDETGKPDRRQGVQETESNGKHGERAVPKKATWKQSLMPFNGRKSDEKYLHLLLRPFPLFFHPGILWACLVQGTLIGWTVLIGVVLAGIMLGPPLWFSELETGYMYTGAFIGALIGFAISGLISDWSAKVLTRWNRGVYEPEFRMVLVSCALILSSVLRDLVLESVSATFWVQA
jgi:hypothetical protein